MPLTKHPSLAIPSQTVIDVLTKLASNPRNYVYIFSGRTKEGLNSLLGSISSLGLAAEHGMFCKHPNSTQWSSLFYREVYHEKKSFDILIGSRSLLDETNTTSIGRHCNQNPRCFCGEKGNIFCFQL